MIQKDQFSVARGEQSVGNDLDIAVTQDGEFFEIEINLKEKLKFKDFQTKLGEAIKGYEKDKIAWKSGDIYLLSDDLNLLIESENLPEFLVNVSEKSALNRLNSAFIFDESDMSEKSADDFISKFNGLKDLFSEIIDDGEFEELRSGKEEFLDWVENGLDGNDLKFGNPLIDKKKLLIELKAEAGKRVENLSVDVEEPEKQSLEKAIEKFESVFKGVEVKVDKENNIIVFGDVECDDKNIEVVQALLRQTIVSEDNKVERAIVFENKFYQKYSDSKSVFVNGVVFKDVAMLRNESKVKNMTVGKDVYLDIYNNVKAENMTVENGGEVVVYNNVKAENVTVENGGEVRVWHNVVLEDVVIKDGGVLKLIDNTIARSLTIDDGGIIKLIERAMVINGKNAYIPKIGDEYCILEYDEEGELIGEDADKFLKYDIEKNEVQGEINQIEISDDKLTILNIKKGEEERQVLLILTGDDKWDVRGLGDRKVVGKDGLNDVFEEFGFSVDVKVGEEKDESGKLLPQKFPDDFFDDIYTELELSGEDEDEGKKVKEGNVLGAITSIKVGESGWNYLLRGVLSGTKLIKGQENNPEKVMFEYQEDGSVVLLNCSSEGNVEVNDEKIENIKPPSLSLAVAAFASITSNSDVIHVTEKEKAEKQGLDKKILPGDRITIGEDTFVYFGKVTTFNPDDMQVYEHCFSSESDWLEQVEKYKVEKGQKIVFISNDMVRKTKKKYRGDDNVRLVKIGSAISDFQAEIKLGKTDNQLNLVSSFFSGSKPMVFNKGEAKVMLGIGLDIRYFGDGEFELFGDVIEEKKLEKGKTEDQKSMEDVFDSLKQGWGKLTEIFKDQKDWQRPLKEVFTPRDWRDATSLFARGVSDIIPGLGIGLMGLNVAGMVVKEGKTIRRLIEKRRSIRKEESPLFKGFVREYFEQTVLGELAFGAHIDLKTKERISAVLAGVAYGFGTSILAEALSESFNIPFVKGILRPLIYRGLVQYLGPRVLMSIDVLTLKMKDLEKQSQWTDLALRSMSLTTTAMVIKSFGNMFIGNESVETEKIEEQVGSEGAEVEIESPLTPTMMSAEVAAATVATGVTATATSEPTATAIPPTPTDMATTTPIVTAMPEVDWHPGEMPDAEDFKNGVNMDGENPILRDIDNDGEIDDKVYRFNFDDDSEPEVWATKNENDEFVPRIWEDSGEGENIIYKWDIKGDGFDTSQGDGWLSKQDLEDCDFWTYGVGGGNLTSEALPLPNNFDLDGDNDADLLQDNMGWFIDQGDDGKRNTEDFSLREEPVFGDNGNAVELNGEDDQVWFKDKNGLWQGVVKDENGWKISRGSDPVNGGNIVRLKEKPEGLDALAVVDNDMSRYLYCKKIVFDDGSRWEVNNGKITGFMADGRKLHLDNRHGEIGELQKDLFQKFGFVVKPREAAIAATRAHQAGNGINAAVEELNAIVGIDNVVPDVRSSVLSFDELAIGSRGGAVGVLQKELHSENPDLNADEVAHIAARVVHDNNLNLDDGNGFDKVIDSGTGSTVIQEINYEITDFAIQNRLRLLGIPNQSLRAISVEIIDHHGIKVDEMKPDGLLSNSLFSMSQGIGDWNDDDDWIKWLKDNNYGYLLPNEDE